MRNLLLFILVILSCCQSKHIQSENKVNSEHRYLDIYDSSFAYHFQILDSAKSSKPFDSIYRCCVPSIKFMEDKTGIQSITDGTFIGKIEFTEYDLIRWHGWYNNNPQKR
jgi:hypothetical protein